jgi:putative membrane protein
MFKGIRVSFAIASAAFLVLASQGAAVASAQQQPAAAADPSSFLERAAEMKFAEIQLAHLAMDKSEDERVKNFAATLIQHEKEHAAPDAVPADTPNVNRLTLEHQQAFDKLSGLSGSEFDREFLEVIVSEHRREVRLFEQEAGIPSHQDTDRQIAPPTPGDMAQIAMDLLPTLRQHLEQAEDIQKQMLASK